MKKKQLFGIICILLALLLLGISVCYIVRMNRKKQEFDRLEKEEYDSIFCSMYDVSGYSEEDFLTYGGLRVIKYGGVLTELQDMSAYLKKAYENRIEMDKVYLGMDPADIWLQADKVPENWQQLLEDNLLSYVKEYPDTTFEIVLPYPSMSYWKDMPDAEVEESFLVYQSFVSAFSEMSNVRIFFLGDEEWLYGNPDNYVSTLGVNSEVARHIYLSTFCDGWYQVDSEAFGEQIQSLEEKIMTEKENPVVYPDLSEYTILFLGDSIIGIDRGTTSIPGVVGSLSGAQVYNGGQGGLTGTWIPGTDSFLSMVDLAEGRNEDSFALDSGWVQSILDFKNRKQKEEILVIVINFGLNDYFQGQKVENENDLCDINTYAGGLRTGIQRLQAAYPQAEIVLMGPTYITLFQEGNEKLSKEGGCLKDYMVAAEEVARDCGIHFKNNYLDLGIDASNESQYLRDGCHLNHQGRLECGVQIIEYLKQFKKEEMVKD